MLHAGAAVGSHHNQVGINLASHIQNDFKWGANDGMTCDAQSFRFLPTEFLQILDGLNLNFFFKNQKGFSGDHDALVLIPFVYDVQDM